LKAKEINVRKMLSATQIFTKDHPILPDETRTVTIDHPKIKHADKKRWRLFSPSKKKNFF